MKISESSLGISVEAIKSALSIGRNNPKAFLTEHDVQSWIFKALVEQFNITNFDCELGVHCQAQFLDQLNNFGFIPDIAILNKNEYNIDPHGALYPRKGCTIYGSSILIEIKLFRGHKSFRKASAIRDIQKLSKVRSLHYPSSLSHDNYFPIFVLICRSEIPIKAKQDIDSYAREHNVTLILENLANQ